LRAGDEALLECLRGATRLVATEGVRSGIAASCRELGLWPPVPAPTGVAEDDCAYQDTTAPLPVIAQRAFNEESRRGRDALLQPLRRRAATASFLADFAGELGVLMPALTESHQDMLREFMARVEEWSATSGGARGSGRSAGGAGAGAERARQALLTGLGLGTLADEARKQVGARWVKNLETPVGLALNVATVGLAVAAGVAVLHRASRRR